MMQVDDPSRQLVPISEIPRRYAEIFEAVDKFGVVYVMKNNQPRARIVSDTYERKMEAKIKKKMELDKKKEEAYERVQRGMKEYREGKIHPVKSLKDLL